MQYLHFRFHANYFLLPQMIPELADDQCSSTTKGSIYQVKHVDTIFYRSRGLTQNLMFNGSINHVFIFADTAFLQSGADLFR